MRYQVAVQELKGAFGALVSLTKKMPPENANGGASISLLRDGQGEYRLVTTHGWFHASVALPGMECLTASRNDELVPFDPSQGAADSAWGFAEPGQILSILAKLPKTASVTLTRKKGASKFVMACGSDKEYEFMLSDPTYSVSGYGTHNNGIKVCSFDEAALDSFCADASAMASIITPSAARPEFESLCLSSEKVGDDTRLRVSANARDDGLSLIDTRADLCEEQFTALLPRETAGGLKGFLGQLASGGNADLMVFPVAPGSKKAKGISLRAAEYELYLTCRTDDFPFANVNNILQAASNPDVSITEPSSALRAALNRTSAMAVTGLAAVTFGVTDAGALSIEQHQGMLAKSIVARETLPSVTPNKFPDDEAVVMTTVNANTMSKAIAKFVSGKEVTICIIGTSGQGILAAQTGTGAYDGLCIVSAALRI